MINIYPYYDAGRRDIECTICGWITWGHGDEWMDEFISRHSLCDVGEVDVVTGVPTSLRYITEEFDLNVFNP